MPSNMPTRVLSGGHRRYVSLGRVLRPVGLKGAVWLESFTEPVQGLMQYKNLQTQTGEALELIKLVPHKGRRCRAEFSGITTRESAANLTGQDLCVLRETLPVLPQGAWYHTDLLGLAVYNNDEQCLGKIKAMHDFGAGHVLEIAPSKGDTFFLPFHSDYVGAIDLEQARLVVYNCQAFLPDVK